MRIAIPLYQNRVSPNILFAARVLITHLAGRAVISRNTVKTQTYTENEWTRLLQEYGVHVLICGGIEKHFMESLEHRNIHVMNNVAGAIGEVVEGFVNGDLRSGYGISYRKDSGRNGTARPVSDPTLVASKLEIRSSTSHTDMRRTPLNCITCIDKSCLDGDPCRYCPLETVAPGGRGRQRKILDVSCDVAGEPDRIMCRVSELVYFALGMEYRHVGIAFCSQMWHEAECVTGVLQRFFEVTPVCCQVGGIREEEGNHLMQTAGHTCNPAGMAVTLNLAETDLNILIGLNMGSDILFQQTAGAPATTLFVKDRLLANNPVGAVYSQYALESIIESS